MPEEEIMQILLQLINAITQYIPNIIAFLTVLVIGYIVGKALGKASATIVRMTGIDKSFKSSMLGKQLDTAGYSFSKIISILMRLIVYILSIITAISLLNIPVLNEISIMVATYIPKIAGAIIVFLVGSIFTEWITDLLEKIIIGEVIPRRIVILMLTGLKYMFYIILVFIAFDIAEIAPHVITSIAQSVFLAIAISIGLSFAFLVGLGLREESILLLSRESEFIRPGIKISIGDITGKIERTTTFLVEIRDEKGVLHIVPKKEFLIKGFKILEQHKK